MSPKKIKRKFAFEKEQKKKKREPEFTLKQLEYIDPHYIVYRNILKMHKERERLAKKRRVSYIV